jgi:hypothetical protein
VRTTLTGTLVEIRDALIVLEGNTHIMLPPDLKVDGFVVGERLMVTVTRQSGRWTAERIERSPV